jgi:hypothetical protein
MQVSTTVRRMQISMDMPDDWEREWRNDGSHPFKLAILYHRKERVTVTVAPGSSWLSPRKDLRSPCFRSTVPAKKFGAITSLVIAPIGRLGDHFS